MKKKILQTSVLAAVLILSACSKEESKAPVLNPPVATTEASSSIIVSPTDVEIDGIQQEIQVSVTGNELTPKTDDYTWLSIKKTPQGLTITALENATGNKRIGVVYLLQNGKEVSKILILQNSRIVYPIPLFDFGKTEKDIKEAELKRPAVLTHQRDVSNGEAGTTINYKVTHNVITSLQYFVGFSGYIRSKISFDKAKLTDEVKQNFEAFLLQEGFEPDTIIGYETTLSMDKKEKKVFIHKAQQVLAEFYNDLMDPHYSFKYYPVQHRAYATFAQLPSIVKNVSLTDIQKQEANSELVNTPSLTGDYTGSNSTPRSRYMYKVNGVAPLVYRQHFFLKVANKTALIQTSFFYNNFNLALYAGLDGGYYLTQEFLELMTQNGFTSSSSSRPGIRYIFTKGTGNNRVNLAVERIKPAEGMDYLLRVQVY